MATKSHCLYTFDVLTAHFEKRNPQTIGHFRSVLDEEATIGDHDPYPLFVTYNTTTKSGSSRLRGCIGTFASSPLQRTLSQYAIVAHKILPNSTKRASQVGVLVCAQGNGVQWLRQSSVSILTDFEVIEDPYDWVLGEHGLQVHFMHRGKGRSATYLPDVAVEQGWNQDETIESLLRKGGFDGTSDWRDMPIEFERYQGTKAKVTHAQYLDALAKLRI